MCGFVVCQVNEHWCSAEVMWLLSVEEGLVVAGVRAGGFFLSPLWER